LQVQRLQWLEQGQHLPGDSSDVDARLISAAKVLKAQQSDLQALQQQSELLSKVSASVFFLS
jgi:hypothetical protein